MKGIYAGMAIGLGGAIYLTCPNKLLGAFLFSLGLITVLVFELNLYTGKVCDLEWLEKPNKLLEMFLKNWGGAAIVGLACIPKPELVQAAQALTIAKLNKHPLEVFVDGVLCGICIAIAVKGFMKCTSIGHHVGGYLMVVMAVMTFILSGAEHIIADLYYFMFATNLIGALRFLALVALGNTVGGVLWCLVGKEIHFGEKTID